MKIRAFTLIELLASIAILGILSALILSSISRSKMSGYKASCINNHRQIGLGWTMYCDDNEGHIPNTVDDGDGIPFVAWVSGNFNFPGDSTNFSLLVDPKLSLLAKYIQNSKVYKCPSDKTDFVRSVSMNNRMNPTRPLNPPLALGGWGTNYSIYKKSSEIGRPSSIFTIIDERSDSINEGNFAVDMSNTGSLNGEGKRAPFWWIDTPANYHALGATISFSDTHVEVHKWVEPSTLGPIGLTGPRRTSQKDRDIS